MVEPQCASANYLQGNIFGRLGRGFTRPVTFDSCGFSRPDGVGRSTGAIRARLQLREEFSSWQSLPPQTSLRRPPTLHGAAILGPTLT
jgi:hypothetical protein